MHLIGLFLTNPTQRNLAEGCARSTSPGLSASGEASRSKTRFGPFRHRSPWVVAAWSNRWQRGGVTAVAIALVAVVLTVVGIGLVGTSLRIAAQRRLDRPSAIPGDRRLQRHPETQWLKQESGLHQVEAKARQAGMVGELRVRRMLAGLDPTFYASFHDLYVPTPTPRRSADPQFTQVDHVVVSRYGIFVIETKNWSGSIYGARDDRYWTVAVGGFKHQRMNPLLQNQWHVRALQDHLGLDPAVLQSIAALVGEAQARTDDVLLTATFGQELPERIKTFNTLIVDDDTRDRCVRLLQELDHPTHRAKAGAIHRLEVVEAPR